MSTRPTVRFLRLPQGSRLAYATHGNGPPLVCPAWWVSHLEDDWEDEGFRTLFGGLAEHHTVVRYDRPGAGLSDRDRDRVDLDDEVETLEALVDHLELDRFAMFAVSCAGPPALSYTARHPDRVSHLVFFGSFLRGLDVGPIDIRDAIQGLVRAHWGMGSRTITNLFAPDLPEDAVKKVSRQHRKAASPEMAAQLLSLTFDVDAESAATGVNTPALVLHRKGDRTIRHDAGRELAASLANSTFETLDGNEHVPWIGDVDRVRGAVLEFLGNEPTQEPTIAEGNGLVKNGDVWAITFDGQTVHLKHARGLADLAILVANAGQDVHVATLWSGAESAEQLGGSADPVLDDEALASYRARYEALETELAEAEARGDAAAAERHRSERELLGAELRAAVGLGGRKRGLGDTSERARKAVTARLRAAIDKIEKVHAELGAHLRSAVSTGTYCSYQPAEATEWTVDPGR